MKNENCSQTDQQQKQPEKLKRTNLFRKMRRPKTLFFLIQVGFKVNQVGKWLLEIELLERLLELLGL